MFKFDFNILWAAKSNFPPGHIIKTHSHNYFHLVFILGGEGEIVLDSVPYQAHINQMYIIHPNVSHKMISSEKNTLYLAELKFHCNDDFTGDVIHVIPAFMENTAPDIHRLFLSILDEIKDQKAYSGEVIALIFSQIVFSLLRDIENSNGQKYHSDKLVNINENAANMQPVRKAIEYINANYAKDLELGDLAKMVCLHRVYFCSVFKELCGMTPMRYLTSVRLENAKKMLVYSEQSISHIADQTGFNSVHYFCRQFTKHFGIPPGKFRDFYQKNLFADFEGNITNFS